MAQLLNLVILTYFQCQVLKCYIHKCYIQPIRVTVGVYTQYTVNVAQITQFTQVLNLVTLTYFQGQVLKRSAFQLEHDSVTLTYFQS